MTMVLDFRQMTTEVWFCSAYVQCLKSLTAEGNDQIQKRLFELSTDKAWRVITDAIVQSMLIQTTQKPKYMQHTAKTPKFFKATVGDFTNPQVRQLQNWANKIAGFRDEWKKEERANQQSGRIAEHSRRCDRTGWEMLMTKGHHWKAGRKREIGTPMTEQTMEKLVMAAWKETEKEHKNYVAERIKRRNEKLNKAHSTNGKYLHQWIRQNYQTPIATMKRTDGSIKMNFQEIHETLVEAWRPIFARWDGGEEPRCSDFEERFGRFIPKELTDAKRITGVELRDRVQHWSNNAAAGADSWKRCEWKQFTDAVNDQVIDGLGKSPGGRSAYSPLQQHCGRPETLCDRKKSAEATAIILPDHERH